MTSHCPECHKIVLLTDCEHCGAKVCGACWARHFERHTGQDARHEFGGKPGIASEHRALPPCAG